MEPWVPGLLAGLSALAVAIVGGLFQIRIAQATARREAAAAKRQDSAPGTPTVQDIWKRQDNMEGAFKASLVLLAESVEQHAEPGKIVFNKTAVNTLRRSGYMPPELENVLPPSTD